MPYSVVWITLPHGFAADGRARLSLVAAPRVMQASASATLAGNPLVNWPGLVRALLDPPGRLRLAVDAPGGPVLAPLELASPLPDVDLWQQLFPPTTSVQVRGLGGRVLRGLTPAASYAQAVEDIDALYTSERRSRHSSQSDAAARLDALADLAAAPDAASRALKSASAAAAAVGSIADLASGLRTAPRLDGATEAGSGPLAGIRSVDQADFHQVVGLLMAHPILSTALGLRIDLLTPAFSGQRNIRVVMADGSPLNGPVLRTQSFSAVVADPSRRVFVMATQPAVGGMPEVANGVLDGSSVTPGDTRPRYLLSTTDAASLSLQLVGLAGARREGMRRAREAGAAVPPAELRLPVRRDIGFTVSQRHRPLTTVAFVADRADAIENPDDALARFSSTRGPAEAAALVPVVDRAALLFADDVTHGYRLDVRTDGGPPVSLMRRQVTYRVGTRALATPPGGDEGQVEPVVAVEQPDGDGVVRLSTGEQLATWGGWGLSAPKPGRKVLGVPGPDGRTTEDTENQPAPGYALQMRVSPVKGSQPRLRFGREYEFQVRAVDLAGNSVAPAAVERSRALPPQRFLRKEAAPSPVVVPNARFSPGESLNRWVVRSDGDGHVEGAGSVRHLVPPKASQLLAERHGMFDAAFGPDASDADRSRALQVALRESGSLFDPTVPGPDGAPVPAAGLAFVSNDPDAPAAPRPPRGEPLPNGYYVVHGGPTMRTPWLADPVCRGASLLGVPGTTGPVVLPFTGRGWPDVQPVRVSVAAGTGPTPKVTVRAPGGVPTAAIALPPATTLHLELATALQPDKLAHLDTATASPSDVVDGAEPTLSARQPITIVHATRRPLSAPAFVGGPTPDLLGGGGTVGVHGPVEAHRGSTGRIDVEAHWTETVDTGEGELLVADRVATAGSMIVPATGPMSFEGRLHLGDLRHRTVGVTPIGTTAFREYFPAVADGDDSLRRHGVPTLVSIPNRLTPPLPDVHSVVPTFGWTTSFDATLQQHTSTRFTTGLRVYLRREWLVTGEDERLGVVVHSTTADGEFARLNGLRVLDFVSQWGGDTLQEPGDSVWEPMTPDDLANSAPRTPVTLTDPGASEDPDQPGGDAPPPMEVTVVSFPVRFDAERDLWFADVPMDIPARWPFVRLAVVRHQPQSVPLRDLSRVVLADFAQLPPTRTLKARRAGGVGVQVEVLGPKDPHSRFQLRQERRLGAPSVKEHDLGTSAGVGPTAIPDPVPAWTNPPAPPPPTAPFPHQTDLEGWRLSDHGPVNGALAQLRLVRAPGAPALDDTLKAQLLAGRVVVEEIQTGMDVRGPHRATRVVYTDVFDRSLIGMNPPPPALPERTSDASELS